MGRSGTKRSVGRVAVGLVGVLLLGTGCTDAQPVRGQLTSVRRVAPAAICEPLSTISELWGVDPLGPEMTAAFESAIAWAPPEVADALQGQSDELWLTPAEAQALEPGLGRRQQNTIDVYAVEQCGESVFDARITEESPQPVDPAAVEQTDLGPNYLPDRQVLTTEAGGVTIRWEMPRINLIDGPRPPRNLDPPAVVTFWAYGGVEVELRYDAMLLTGLAELGANDDEVVREALSRFNGGAPIVLGVSQRSGGRVELSFEEQVGERVFIGRAYSWAGNVFTVAVGIPWNREDLMNAATVELERFDSTVVFEQR